MKLETIFDVIFICVFLGLVISNFVDTFDHKVFVVLAVSFGCLFGILLYAELRELNTIRKDEIRLINEFYKRHDD
jgi:hypothetical protein